MSQPKVKAPGGTAETPKPISPISQPSQSPEPETSPEAETTTTSPDYDGAAHLLDIETGEAPGDPGEAGAVDAAPAQLSKEDFFGLFKFAFSAPNMALAAAGRQPLHSLPIAQAEEAEARAASDALYEIAEETAALRWLLAPEAPWLQRAIPILIFVQGKAVAVMGEVRARRAKRVDASPLQGEAIPPDPLREASTEPPVMDAPGFAAAPVSDYPQEVRASVH